MERIHLTNSDIILDDNKKEYQTGEEVSGILFVAIKGRLLLSNIKIGLVCMAEVKWVENPGTRYHREGHVYHERKKLLDFLYEIPKTYADNCLGEGEHVIPFKFRIPDKGLPSTFVSPHGSVTYYVEVIIEEPIIDEVHKIGSEIIVDSPLGENLNLSVGGSTEKDLSLLCFGSGALTLYGNIEKKGFIRGEMVEVHCTIENMSTVNATPRATLYQTQIYMCGERHKALEIALTAPVVGSEVEKETNSTETIFVLIPKEASLSIKSPIISIKYFIHLTLDIPHAIDLHLNLPIVVTNKQTLDKYAEPN